MMSTITTSPERETTQIYLLERSGQIFHHRSTLQPFWSDLWIYDFQKLCISGQPHLAPYFLELTHSTADGDEWPLCLCQR